MPRSSRVLAGVLIAVVAVISAGAFAYWHYLLRAPLEGDLSHDFGEVALYQENEEVHHTFHLTNAQNHPLTIVAVKPECGCLTTRDVHETLQPGESFELPVTLIAKGGERVVPIRVLFSDDSMMTLKVSATGRYMPRLHVNPPAITLNESGEGEFVLRLDTYASWDDPQPPTIASSDENLQARFADWKLKFRPKDVVMTPTHWEALIRVAYEAPIDRLGEDATLTIDWPPARTLSLPVRVSQELPSTTTPLTVP